MYVIVLTHELAPGKLPEVKAWCKHADEERRKNDPNYKPPRRYITVFGSVHHFVAEFEMDRIPEEPAAFAEAAPEGAQDEFLRLIVPGRTEIRVLKELDLGS